MDRRTFLKGLLATSTLGILPDKARAFGESSRMVFAHGRYAGNWAPRRNALRRLAFEIGARTSISVAPEEKVLDLHSPDLFYYPFLYLAGDAPLPTLRQAEIDNLRRYVRYGGFVLCDGSDPDGAFADSCETFFSQLLPGAPTGRIPADHVLYKSFYLLDHPAGRTLTRPWQAGLVDGGRLAVAINATDLGGAGARDELGAWEYEGRPGGEGQREQAFRLGVNTVMYAMCTDYKEDQVHIPFIMKRRR